MARTKGSANFAGSLEVLAGAPLDAREVVETVADLTTAATFDYVYVGLKVYVKENHKIYVLNALDFTDSSNWSEVGSGGSGSGGHTIEGDGTAVTDRDTLNFKDMSVSDDSQNEKTDVKPHRLTQSELADIISPLPFFDFSNPGAEAFIFSTNERVIGQWIDGKPLYQKSFTTTLATDIDQTSIPVNVSVDKYIDIKVIQYSNNYYRPFTFISDDLTKYMKIFAANNAGQYANTLFIKNTNQTFRGTDAIVTARYTKTTDQPVATGEKIVGQWIDGKPLYEKIWIFDSSLTLASNTWTDTSVLKSGFADIVNAQAFLSGEHPMAYPVYVSANPNGSQYIQLMQTRNNAMALSALKLTYTKT